ncbi:hypothetical protein GCM10027085_13180 [Spirosoma aerophilum]
MTKNNLSYLDLSTYHALFTNAFHTYSEVGCAKHLNRRKAELIRKKTLDPINQWFRSTVTVSG